MLSEKVMIPVVPGVSSSGAGSSDPGVKDQPHVEGFSEGKRMNSSGIKRGLAATAIGALAVTGLPAFTSSAFADSINDEVGAGNVTLYSQFTGGASIQNDGVNQTIHLLAGAGSDATQVRFQYDNGGATPVVIATVNRDSNGAFSFEWAPPVAIINTTVDVEAVSLNAGGTALATDSVSTLVSANARAVDIANAPGSALGAFVQPYTTEGNTATLGAVTGTTSGNSVELSERTDNAATTTPATLGTANAQGISPFNGTVDLSNYGFDTTATAPIVNEAIIGASVNGGNSDDAEVVKVAKQSVGNVDVTSSPATPIPNGATKITVTVTDAASGGKPVAGAQVVADQATGADGAGIADAKYTDGNGQVTYNVNAPTPAGSKAYSFYVNTTDVDAFENGVDFRKSVTVTSVAQNVQALTSSSADGAQFDFNEYDAPSDISALLKDQSGRPFAGQTVSYSYTFVPFNAPPTGTTVTPPPRGLAVTDANGKANIPFVPATKTGPGTGDYTSGTYTLNVFVDNNGTPGQQDGELAAAPLVFKAGDSTLAFSDVPVPSNGAATDATKIAGTTATFDASLKLGDGTALPGRTVRFTYSPKADSFLAAQGGQPAGTTRSNDTVAVGTTDAAGVTSVAVTDPVKTPDAAELGNNLDAETIVTPATAPAVASSEADEVADTLDLDFVDNTPNFKTTVKVVSGGIGKPGTATSGTVTLTEDADKDAATAETPVGAGQAVTLTVGGKAFFTDGTYKSGATGSDAELKNLGQTLVVQTGDNPATPGVETNYASFQTSIARDEGFDDDGKVTAVVTGAAGTFSGKDNQVFDSSMPINGGDVKLVRTPNQNIPTDPARTGDAVADQVKFDVFTTDQFDNRVGGASVAITDSSATATTTTPAQSDFVADGDFTVSDTAAETVTLTGKWTTGTTVYTAAPNTVGAGQPETLTGTATQEFYTVDFNASKFTIVQNPDGRVAVGSAVTEVVTIVDQKGNPIAGLNVAFIRQGPGNQQDGDENRATQTNANGQSFYTFTGTEAGTARVSAVIFDGTPLVSGPNRKIISDDVTFGDAQPPVKTPIAAQVNGQNNGAKNDRVRIKTTPSAGNARVKLFTRANNGFSGRKVLLKETRLNANGRKTFVRPDKNGNRITKYWVVVRGTDTTKRDRSNTKKLR